MTHPARLPAARRLAAQNVEMNLQVACDPAPELGPGTLRTARAAWRLVAPGATHHMVIQDDVILPRNFFEHVAASLERHPDRALAFFAEWGSCTATAIRVAALRGASWAEVVDWYVPTQALALPADVANGVDGYAAAQPADTPDDHVLLDHLRRCGVPVYASVPNLLQHADAPSLVGNQEAMGLRRATCYTPELAAAGVPDGPVLSGLTHVPHFRWWDRWSECVTRANPEDTAWDWEDTRTTRSWLESAGVPASLLRVPLDEVPDGPAGAGSLRERAGDAVLEDLWLTAFAVGLIAGDGHDVTEEAMTRETAARAVDSLAPGALRVVLGPGDPSPLTDLLLPFVRGAVLAGARPRPGR
jgi:hypothetical protein